MRFSWPTPAKQGNNKAGNPKASSNQKPPHKRWLKGEGSLLDLSRTLMAYQLAFLTYQLAFLTYQLAFLTYQLAFLASQLAFLTVTNSG
ncbi:hypothetical protein AYI96_03105 [Shewanella sp. MSW]|nr:hypothetical protein AYI96_03105 [Shewanella sp. MSW]